VEEQYDGHCEHEENGGPLTHLKRPRNVRQIVEDYVGQRRIAIHVGDSVVNDDHDERGEHEHKEHVDVADEELDEIGVEVSRDVVKCVRFNDSCGGGRLVI